jgi:DNA-binding transcriptional MerR regulator
VNGQFKQGQVPEGHLTSSQILAVVGCSYRQLDYWCRTGLVNRENTNGPGTGHWRTFSRAEALRILAVSELSAAGLTISRIREIDPDVIEVIKGAVTITLDDRQLEQRLDTLTAQTLL